MGAQRRKDVHVTPSTSSAGGPGPAIDPTLARMRREYPDNAADQGLYEADLAPRWPEQFSRWLDAAVAAGLPEPNAMIFATADPAGRPSARTVLLKGYDERGFTLFTNYR